MIFADQSCRNLIAKHARLTASDPVMWGGRTPTPAGVQKLAATFVTEWTTAVTQLTRHWDIPPTISGN
jgi:hypothetical protein